MTKLRPAERDLLERVKEKEELHPFFFRKAKGLKWFDYLEEAGFFAPDQNPRPVPSKEEGYVNIRFWPVTEYLVSTAPELASVDGKRYAEKFIEIIRSATGYARENGFSNYRTWWHFSKIIQNIPPDIIQVDDIALIDYWLVDPYDRGLVAKEVGEGWLFTLLENGSDHCKGLSLKLLESIYALDCRLNETKKKTRKTIFLRFEPYYARKINKKIACNVGKLLGIDAAEFFRKQLETILTKEKNDQFSYVWRSAIEDHRQNQSANDVEDIIIEIYRDVLLAYIKDNPESALKYIEELLDCNFKTIKRIAIFAIDQRFRYLASLVDRLISIEYFDSNCRHEMWHLVHNHYKDFTLGQAKRLLGLINDLIETDDQDQISDGGTSYKRSIWLSAIKDYDASASKQYRENVKRAGAEPKNPDFASYMTSGFVDHKSPVTVEKLLSLEIQDLVSEILSAKDLGTFGEPSFRGLVKSFQQAVKADPLKFHSVLNEFTKIDLPFVHSIIEAYHQLWTEKAQLPWDEIWNSLLGFCLEIIKQKRFWSAENAKKRPSFVANRYWIVASISRLIEAGTKTDDHAFSDKYLKRAEEIISLMLKKEKGEKFKHSSDAISLSINSPRGQCLEALINLALRCCRISDNHADNHSNVWAHFQPTFDAELARSEKREYEFVTLVGSYIPNFLYMSNDWVIKNLEHIFDHSNYQKWLCAMQGYSYVGSVYENIYTYLKDSGHVLKVLDDVNLKENVKERFIENIAVAFINDFDDIDRGLIGELINRGRHAELSHLVWFLWTLRKEDDKKIRDKIISLWEKILKIINTDTKQGRLVASNLCDWTAFLDEINERNRHLVLAVAPFAGENHNTYSLIQSIARISANQPKDAYEIWLRLLEGESRPDFPEEAIREALANLTHTGPAGLRMAREISSEYLRGGNDRPNQLLREVIGLVEK